MALAFDDRRVSASARSYDADGRLRVELTPVSKATVSEYLGSEIPGASDLGLDPQATYAMFRPAAELRRAASTMCGVPVLSQHVPMNATTFDPAAVVGACLDDAVFESPYLRCSIIIWSADAIKGIEDGSARQLSAGYAYKPDMRPGVFETVPYDGKMVDLRFNHLAIVNRGRNGPDVMVAVDFPAGWLGGVMQSHEDSRRWAVWSGGSLSMRARQTGRVARKTSNPGGVVVASAWERRRPSVPPPVLAFSPAAGVARGAKRGSN
jgi:hypothetical protein